MFTIFHYYKGVSVVDLFISYFNFAHPTLKVSFVDLKDKSKIKCCLYSKNKNQFNFFKEKIKSLSTYVFHSKAEHLINEFTFINESTSEEIRFNQSYFQFFDSNGKCGNLTEPAMYSTFYNNEINIAYHINGELIGFLDKSQKDNLYLKDIIYFASNDDFIRYVNLRLFK